MESLRSVLKHHPLHGAINVLPLFIAAAIIAMLPLILNQLVRHQMAQTYAQQNEEDESLGENGGTELSTQTTALTLSFSLSGIDKQITGNISPDRQITAEITDLGSPESKTTPGGGTIRYNKLTGTFVGTITFDKTLEPGIYLMSIKTHKYARHFAGTLVVAPDKTATLANLKQPIRLIAGDIDDDGTITLFDYNLLTGCIRTIDDSTDRGSCSLKTEIRSDLNEDRMTDQIDYNLFLRSIRESALITNH